MGVVDRIWYIVGPQNILNKILFERHLTISTYLLFLDGRNPASQAADKKRQQLGGVMNHLNQAGIGKHIYCVLCIRMTPDQKQIVRKRSRIDTQLYIDILTWFVKESGHPG